MDSILNDIERKVMNRLQRELQPQQAQQVSFDIVDSIARDWGGQRPYIPASDKIRRNSGILSQWESQRAAGRVDRNAIAKQFNVHRTTVDRVIAAHLNAIRSPFG